MAAESAKPMANPRKGLWLLLEVVTQQIFPAEPLG